MQTLSQTRVQTAIERRAARGEAVTVRGVQEELISMDGSGASFGTITPLVRVWNLAHDGDAKVERRASASDDFANTLSRVGRTIARAISREIAQAIATQRVQDLVVIEGLQEELATLGARIATLEAKPVWREEGGKRSGNRPPKVRRTSSVNDGVAARSRRGNPHLGIEQFEQTSVVPLHKDSAFPLTPPPSEAASLQVSVDQAVSATRIGQTKTAVAAFNHNVVQDIVLVLSAHAQHHPHAPALSPEEIIERLPPEVLGRIERWNGRLAVTADIHEIVRNRILHKRYVRREDRGRYAVFTNWREQKDIERRERNAAKGSRQQPLPPVASPTGGRGG